MINCAYCQTGLDDDSFFCDQCGKEILLCTQCGKTGIGKRCIDDGKPLVPAQMKALGVTSPPSSVPNPVINVQSVSPNISPAPFSKGTHSGTVSSVQTEENTLVLINSRLNLKISLQNSDIIGRNQGQHTTIFEQYAQVSGRHAQFTFDQIQKVWYVTDLNSTNHTRVGTSPNFSSIAPIQPQKPVLLQNGQFLLIANLEFMIQISNGLATETQTGDQSGTIRVI